MVKCGFSLTKKEIVTIVGDYVNKNNIKNSFKNGIPGKDWFYSFKERYNLVVSEYQLRAKSLNAYNPCTVNSYFYLLKDTMDDLQLHDKPSQIWNIDESYFCKDHTRSKNISLQRCACAAKRTTPGNTTVLLGCNAAGVKIPPLIIFEGQYLWDKWICKDIYPDTVYAATENGMMQPDLFEIFFEGTLLPIMGAKRPALLIYNGQSVHVGINIVEKAREAGITILKIPIDTTEILQPLHFAIDKSFRDKWHHCIEQWESYHVDQELSNKEFSKLICEVWSQFEPDSLIEGFQKAGVFPYNVRFVSETSVNQTN